jgi:hypothetical protein
LLLLLGRAGFSPRLPNRQAAYRSAEGISVARKGEATENIAFIFAVSFFPRFLSKKRMSSPKTTYPIKQK